MVIFLNISPTSNHLHPLQVENCDSNSRLVVDEDDNGKCRSERANPIWNIVVIRKKGIAFFSNSLNLWKFTKSKMAAMFPRYYLFHHNF